VRKIKDRKADLEKLPEPEEGEERIKHLAQESQVCVMEYNGTFSFVLFCHCDIIPLFITPHQQRYEAELGDVISRIQAAESAMKVCCIASHFTTKCMSWRPYVISIILILPLTAYRSSRGRRTTFVARRLAWKVLSLPIANCGNVLWIVCTMCLAMCCVPLSAIVARSQMRRREGRVC